MLTYGYIRQAILAHIDLDEEEASDMNLLSRFPIFANEAMQAICAIKPKYEYVTITVVNELPPLVKEEGGNFHIATVEEIKDEEHQLYYENDLGVKEWFIDHNIYKINEVVKMPENFIAFADKKPIKVTERRPSVTEVLEAEAFNRVITKSVIKSEASKTDFMYASKNSLVFFKEGMYYIPAKFVWYMFDFNIDDETEIDIPTDIFMTIPLYVASVCLQIDNPQRAQLKRNEFEVALSRCTVTDFMPLKDIKASW